MTTLQASTLANPGFLSRWIGRVLAALVIIFMVCDAGMNLLAPHLLVEAMRETGFPLGLSGAIGTIALVATVLYAIPQTSVLGAVLLTAFLGGAICAHLRIGQIGSPPQILSFFLGIAAWASLYLRVPAVRAVFPSIVHR